MIGTSMAPSLLIKGGIEGRILNVSSVKRRVVSSPFECDIVSVASISREGRIEAIFYQNVSVVCGVQLVALIVC